MPGIATHSLDPASYYDEAIHQKEQQKIFLSHWLCVGLTFEFETSNDFKTLEINGLPVVIQNIEGEIQAFLNICRHRKARIQMDSSGNRPLICPYHCWKYGKDGALKQLPQNQRYFQLDQKEIKKLSLTQFPVALCGAFVFVCLSPSSKSSLELQSQLACFLGQDYSLLETLSQHFTQSVDQGELFWRANWKLAVETVLESYHVAGTHPESFFKLVHNSCDLQIKEKHNAGHSDLKPETKHWWQGVRKKLNLNQFRDFREYNHFFIYPNLAIAITNGSLMSVQTYCPISAEKSLLRYQLCLAKPSPDGEFMIASSKTFPAFKKAVFANFCHFNHLTLEEDRVMAESCQKNMRFAVEAGLLGENENRVRAFHHAWRKDMQNS